MKHVYILGAGFSVPLGGPLFNDLLTNKCKYLSSKLDIPQPFRDCIFSLFPDINPREDTETLRPIEKLLKRPLNAEALLELIDYCSKTDCHEANCLLQTMYQCQMSLERKEVFFKTLLVYLRRTIAIQCDWFTQRMRDDKDNERYKPYRRWFELLSGNDVIVTFNYDTAVEALADLANRSFPAPGQYQNGRPHLVKLHGSADWCEDGGKIQRRKKLWLENDVCIGMPGSEKAEMASSLFKSQWQSAFLAIRDADVISIVGYSMPETDNDARMMIIDAIAESERDKRQVNLVLGPDTGSVRARRMQAILEPIARCQIIDRPFYAQDYLPYVQNYLPRTPGSLLM